MGGQEFYILLTGGFGDNLKIYCFKYAHPEYRCKFVNVPNTPDIADNVLNKKLYLEVISKHNPMEVGQKNTNMSLFNFPDVIDHIPPGVKLYINHIQIENNGILQFNIHKYKRMLRPFLLQPRVKYSNTCKRIFEEVSSKRYGLIGIRWKYPCVGNPCRSFFMFNAGKFVKKLTRFMKKHRNIVLMFDDWSYTDLFIGMFSDLINEKQHRIISLENIPINNIHEMLKIGSAIDGSDFLHNYSGFYQVVELVVK